MVETRPSLSERTYSAPYLAAAYSTSSFSTAAPPASASAWTRLQASGPPTPLPPAAPSPRRLLMPTVRAARLASLARSPRVRAQAGKRASRLGSLADAAAAAEMAAPGPAQDDVGLAWLGHAARFEITHEELQLPGFTLHAVEKWVTERTRAVVTLAVYTGSPADAITVTALAPCASLTPEQQQAEWETALKALKSNGARPRETPLGTLMVTSLANFRSDYTLVPIPSGAFLEVRERLYTNINLLRMGCTGRTALTLEEPSDATKDRFIGTYQVAESVRPSATFSLTVLTLVKLLQTALSLFGFFPAHPTPDGLLCDITAASLQRWVAVFGEPYLGIEPMERIADPATVAGLLSLVLAARTKLSALGFSQSLPKDPFADPACFRAALAAFQGSRLCPLLAPAPGGPAAALAPDTLDALDQAYDRSRQAEQFKLHRLAINKLDELREGITAAPSSSAALAAPTADMRAFARALEKRGKDAAPSVRYLWTGRAGELVARERAAERERERERVLSDAEDELRPPPPPADPEAPGAAPDDASSASEAEGAHRVWGSRRVQRKIEAWAARAKRGSVDHQNRGPGAGPGQTGSALALGSGAGLEEPWQHVGALPAVVVTTASREQDDDDVLSSGQTSPMSTHNGFYLEPAPGNGRATATTSLSNLSDFDRLVRGTHGARPPHPRVTSWSDPRSALGKLPDADPDSPPVVHHAREETLRALPSGRARRRMPEPTLRRRRSADDVGAPGARVLPVDRMKIDVDLAGQLLIMRRRAAHLSGVVSVLAALTAQLSASNAALKDDYRAHRAALQAAEARGKVVAATEAARGAAARALQDARALSYETAQFEPAAVWRAVAPARDKVLQARLRVLGSERRVPGALGRYTRAYAELGGAVRRVDVRGRSEGEAEEERGLPDAGLDAELDADEAAERERVAAEEEARRPGAIQPAPTWLLRLFESWTQRWRKQPEGAGADAAPKPLITRDDTDLEGEGEGEEEEEDGSGSRSPSLDTIGEDDEGRGEVEDEKVPVPVVVQRPGDHPFWVDGEHKNVSRPPSRCYSPASIAGYASD